MKERHHIGVRRSFKGEASQDIGVFLEPYAGLRDVDRAALSKAQAGVWRCFYQRSRNDDGIEWNRKEHGGI